MSQLGALLFDGLVLGSSYVLVALGLTMIYGILRVLNIAHGDIFMVGAFVGVVITARAGLNYGLGMVGAIIVCALLALIVERIAVRPIRRGPELGTLMSTLAISVILENLALIIFGGDPLYLNTAFLTFFIHFAGISFSAQRLLIVLVAIALVATVYGFLRWTDAGKALRAVSQEPEAASLMGINVNLIIAVTFMIGFGLAGLAGVLMGPILLVSPFMGQAVTLKAFAIIVLGGFGNVNGAIIAAFIIGIAESLTAGYLSGAWSDSLAFIILILVLLIRPTGLVRERVEQNI